MNEEHVLARLRAIHGDLKRRKAVVREEIRTGRATVGWGNEEMRRAHQKAIAECDKVHAETDIDAETRRRVEGMRKGLVERRDWQEGRLVEGSDGALRTVVAEAQHFRRTPPDPLIARTTVDSLVRRGTESASLPEVGDIIGELEFRAENGSEAARTALYSVRARALALAADEPVVRQRAAEVPRLEQVAEHIGIVTKAIRENDDEDRGLLYEDLGRISAARARGDRRSAHSFTAHDGTTRAELVGPKSD
jgi:hypothetical protein